MNTPLNLTPINHILNSDLTKWGGLIIIQYSGDIYKKMHTTADNMPH